MNIWEVKLSVGKSTPRDILTYLKDQTQNLREKFMKAEERFTLTRYTNANHSKIEVMSEELEAYETITQKQEVKIREQDLKIEALTKGLVEANERIEKLMKAVAIQKAKRLFGERKD